MHAHRGGVDQAVCPDRSQSIPGDKGTPQLGGQIQAFGLGPVGKEYLDAGFDQAKTHSPGGAAGADDEHGAALKVHGIGQGLIGSQPVGIVALAQDIVGIAAVKEQGVHRSDLLRHRIYMIKVGHDLHLEGDRDRNTDKTEGLEPMKTMFQIVGLHGYVNPVDPQLGNGGVVHRRTHRVGNGPTNDAEERCATVNHCFSPVKAAWHATPARSVVPAQWPVPVSRPHRS